MRARTAVVGAGATAVLAAVAVRQIDRRWAGADDPCGPDELRLPEGDELTVTTDDGAELAMTIAGDGPLVVLAHCWTGSRAMWAPVAHRLLADGHRVVLYDQRGHGDSTVGDDGFTIPRLGADLRAVLVAVDARGAVVAGHSMGGMTIQSLANHHPDALTERVKAIVLVATAASGLSRNARADLAGQRLIASPRVERLLRGRAGHALVRGTVGTARRSHLVLTRDLFVNCPPEARSGLLNAMQAMDLREGIAGIGVPTTVLVGSRDRLTPPHRAAELADTIPGAELTTLPGAGHQLPLEAPDEVTDAIAKAVVHESV